MSVGLRPAHRWLCGAGDRPRPNSNEMAQVLSLRSEHQPTLRVLVGGQGKLKRGTLLRALCATQNELWEMQCAIDGTGGRAGGVPSTWFSPGCAGLGKWQRPTGSASVCLTGAVGRR